jgi:hypothetical protein
VSDLLDISKQTEFRLKLNQPARLLVVRRECLIPDEGFL